MLRILLCLSLLAFYKNFCFENCYHYFLLIFLFFQFEHSLFQLTNKLIGYFFVTICNAIILTRDVYYFFSNFVRFINRIFLFIFFTKYYL